MRPHILIMAGGTGGHVFPALAVAQQLDKQGVRITWLGTQRGLEASVIPANNIDIEWLSIEGLRGKGMWQVLFAPFKLLRAMCQAFMIMRRIKPDCVLGMGGFVTGPGGLVAYLLGKPLIVHEQNAVAGLTNRYLAKLATQVLAGFPDVQGLPKRTRWVGNPVRQRIAQPHPAKTNKEKPSRHLLIIGGSQGAHSFNTLLPPILSELIELGEIDDLTIWHQTGRQRHTAVSECYAQHNQTAKVTEFIDDMASAYAWADLLICRAGAMTIAECCAAGKPAVLIPYPFSAGDHQIANAQAMVTAGAAKMLLNEQIQLPLMRNTLIDLFANPTQLAEMGQRGLSLYKPRALSDVAQVCEAYLHA